MNDNNLARSGYWRGDRLELALRYAYRAEFVPLLMDYIGACSHTRILEVGCGSAFLSRVMARTLKGTRVFGIDTDPGMLEVAGQLVERDGLDGRIQLASGDAYWIPFADEQFDLVTSHRVL